MNIQKMSEIIIHIGLHKTGTSSIQKSLASSRDYLAEHGFFYPPTGNFSAHHELAAMLRINHVDIDGIRERFCRQIEQIAKIGRSSVVLSSEIFSEPIDCSALSILDNIFSRVRIVLYVRRPDYLFESAYAQQVVQSGEARKINEYNPYFIDFCSHIDKYRNGSKNRTIEVREYTGADVVADFWFGILNVPRPEHGLVLENRSLSAVGCETLRRLNKIGTGERLENISRIRSICNEFGASFIRPVVGNMLGEQYRLRIQQVASERNSGLEDEFGVKFTYSNCRPAIDLDEYASEVLNRLSSW